MHSCFQLIYITNIVSCLQMCMCRSHKYAAFRLPDKIQKHCSFTLTLKLVTCDFTWIKRFDLEWPKTQILEIMLENARWINSLFFLITYTLIWQKRKVQVSQSDVKTGVVNKKWMATCIQYENEVNKKLFSTKST